MLIDYFEVYFFLTRCIYNIRNRWLYNRCIYNEQFKLKKNETPEYFKNFDQIIIKKAHYKYLRFILTLSQA
jgi:hypothetical protein